ncbi:hypothetical protein FHS31_002924 [Sphingomonas vulcanisoli]|uniref:Uncharacterized protein n=1 Tax=Sphingomonas vulcanisoli TaxID=1658060 RepID=A0ABX0TUT8_9SPHN|nr:hypothetical protein [Sphingomonas vulcanisoli]NIJ09292.1 hypothetical protein [Sphingomonas vulcanisoli]
MDERDDIREEAIAATRRALHLLDQIGERGPAALVQQAIDQLTPGFDSAAFDVVDRRFAPVRRREPK